MKYKIEFDDIMSFDNMIGECEFGNVEEFLRQTMQEGNVFILHYRPNSDRDFQIYQFKERYEIQD